MLLDWWSCSSSWSFQAPVRGSKQAIEPESILVFDDASMLLLGLELGHVTYPWSSAFIISLIIAGTSAIVVSWSNELRVVANLIIPLMLFSILRLTVLCGIFTGIFYTFTRFAHYLPLLSQSLLGANALSRSLPLTSHKFNLACSCLRTLSRPQPKGIPRDHILFPPRPYLLQS